MDTEVITDSSSRERKREREIFVVAKDFFRFVLERESPRASFVSRKFPFVRHNEKIVLPIL